MNIMIAGTIVVDNVKMIPSYPPPLALVSIQKIHKTLGGLLPNVAVDLAKLDPKLRIQAVGCIGNDGDGEFVRQELSKYPGIDLQQVRTVEAQTSFTDVMTVESTGERTFFTYTGSDALLAAADFDFSSAPPSLLHIGYVLLLPGLDAADATYGTQMARVLARAREAGVKTSIDAVSEAGERFEKLVLPALKYTDYCTINEFEAERITKVCLRNAEGNLLEENMEEALRALRTAGVHEWVTIHCPEGAFGLDENDRYVRVPSEKLAPEQIRSTVGAGDAFAAGLLLSILHDLDYAKALQVANTVAAMSLSGIGASDGIPNWEAILSHVAARGE